MPAPQVTTVRSLHDQPRYVRWKSGAVLLLIIITHFYSPLSAKADETKWARPPLKPFDVWSMWRLILFPQNKKMWRLIYCVAGPRKSQKPAFPQVVIGEALLMFHVVVTLALANTIDRSLWLTTGGRWCFLYTRFVLTLTRDDSRIEHTVRCNSSPGK